MPSWSIAPGDLKKYPHFDGLISAHEAEALATDPALVATHTFYPFMLYVDKWKKFGSKGARGKIKERPIRFAARRDAYIYSYYRHVLSEKYEAELQSRGLADCVLAYRRVPEPGAKGGKCNIHFARDAFANVAVAGNCCAIALDISGFFESLDHGKLKEKWSRILGVKKLPSDHFKVFEAITRYSVVEKKAVYERLGHYGVKKHAKNGAPIMGYTTRFEDMPKQLCTGKRFREVVAGEGSQKSIIKVNHKPWGIPQGAPISDLLANLYLLDFDQAIADRVRELGGSYFRYSDDILIVIPGDERAGRAMMQEAIAEISNHGARLTIKAEKSSLFTFEKCGDKQRCRLVCGEQGKNGLEYLGFRYNGEAIYIRDATLSSLRRKVARVACAEANAMARRYPTKDVAYLRAKFNYERLIQRFGRVEDFKEKSAECRNWTFWTYAKRAVAVLGDSGSVIYRQLKSHRKLIRDRVNKELELAVVRRQKRLGAKSPLVSMIVIP